jgi:hypothetical protein
VDPVQDYCEHAARLITGYDQMCDELEEARTGVTQQTALWRAADLMARMRAEQRRLVRKLVALQSD